MEKIIALVFTLFVLLNEILLTFGSKVGAFMYLILMSAAFLLLSKQETLDNVGQMIVVFLAIPLVRIAGLFTNLPYMWKVSLGSGILLFLGVYYIYRFDIDIGDFEYFWMLPLIICLSAVFGILGNIAFGGSGSLVLIIVLPLVVFSEEIFFRGLVQNSIEKSCGIFYSIIIPAVIYGALSIHLGTWFAVLFFTMSVFSGLLYASTKNIFLSITFNLIVSAFVFIVPNLI